jgi:hypothetical protein
VTVSKKFSGSDLVRVKATLATAVLLIMASEACADFTEPVIFILDGDMIEDPIGRDTTSFYREHLSTGSRSR